MPHLSADDVSRLTKAQQVLLSPLESGDAVEWRLRANRAVRHLLGADHSVFSVGTEAGPAIVTEDTDPTFNDKLVALYYVGVDNGDHRYRDRWMDEGVRTRRAIGTAAHHDYTLSSPEEIRRSPVRQDVFSPVGLTNLAGLSTPMPMGEASIYLSFNGVDGEARSEEALPLLQLLVPAFEAGVLIHHLLLARRAALVSMLDRLGEALAIYSTRAVPLHRNHAFAELLADEPEAKRLLEGADVLAHELVAARWNRRRGVVDRADPTDARRYVRTRATEYRLLGSYVPAELFGADGVLVQVQRLAPLLPSAAALRSRLGLTEREAEVALLLAEGLTDRAIAERLSLSPHTARRHGERVLRKLGVHTRAAIALRLLRASLDGSP